MRILFWSRGGVTRHLILGKWSCLVICCMKDKVLEQASLTELLKNLFCSFYKFVLFSIQVLGVYRGFDHPKAPLVDKQASFQGFRKNTFMLHKVIRHDFDRNGQCWGMSIKFAAFEILIFCRYGCKMGIFGCYLYKFTSKGQQGQALQGG